MPFISSFFNFTAATYFHTLSLHDALPISICNQPVPPLALMTWSTWVSVTVTPCSAAASRSEEHTSELQSHHDLVCRLLLEKKNTLCDGALRVVFRTGRALKASSRRPTYLA